MNGERGRPAAGGSMSSIRDHLAPVAEPVRVDAVDLEILRMLEADGRMPQKRLAEELGMSAPAVSERISRLVQRGVIGGYTARIDWAALGYGTVAYLQVTISHTADRGRLMLDLANAPGVEEVVLVTGQIDVLVKLRVRDNRHLRQVLTESIWSIEGIERTETSLVLGDAAGIASGARILADLAARPGPAS